MNELIRCNDDITINGDKYKPTPAEQRLLETLLNPESVGKSVTDKCQMAEISRETYYGSMKKPEFTALLNKTSVDLIKDKISEILAASVKSATTGGSRGFQDRKMLLSMFGTYVERQDINLQATARQQQDLSNMDDAELEEQFVLEILQKRPEIVARLMEKNP